MVGADNAAQLSRLTVPLTNLALFLLMRFVTGCGKVHHSSNGI